MAAARGSPSPRVALAFVAAATLGVLPGVAAATTFKVNNTADRHDFNTADPFCDSNPNKQGRQCTLRAGVEQTNAQPGRDRLLLTARTFAIKPDVGFGQLTVSDDLLVDGTSSAKTVIRLGAPSSRIFEVGVGARLDLRDATVRDGVVADSGGGIRNLGTLILRRSRVLANEAFANPGGGIYAAGPTTIIDSQIGGPKAGHANHAAEGGGIYHAPGGGGLDVRDSVVRRNVADSASIVPVGGGITAWFTDLEVIGSEIRGNVARYTGPPLGGQAYGGGVFATDGAVAVRGSLVAGNRVEGGFSSGGGINVWDGALTVAGSTIRANTGSADASGGGISYGFAPAAELRVLRSTLSQNSVGANGVGGGILIREGDGELENVTTSRNEAGGFSGGADVLVLDASLDASHLTLSATDPQALSAFSTGNPGTTDAAITLRASVLTGRSQPVCAVNGSGGTSPSITSSGFNVARGTTCNLNLATDRQGVNPRLAPLASNGGPTQTHALRTRSPAINRVAKAACPPPVRDQRGVMRPRGKRCDAGAYER